MIEATLSRVTAGEHLSMDEMASTMDAVVGGSCSAEEIGQLLLALRRNGETVAEVAGAAKSLRRHMTPIRCRRQGLVDTCGTGGDASGTFNISTAAALVTAAAGVAVAKHGNRSVTSLSGSADALAALGVNIEAAVPRVEHCLDRLGICFCFAPLLHQAMKNVAPVRKSLGVPTIFNIIGPLTNPAAAEFQLLGVGRAELRPLLADALLLLGVRRALVVRGDDGLDEITIAGPTRVSEVNGGRVREFTWQPADFGLRTASLDLLRVTGPDQSAAMIREVLAGRRGPARDIVVLNASAALWVAGHSDDLRACAGAAAAAIDSSAAARLLQKLVKETCD